MRLVFTLIARAPAASGQGACKGDLTWLVLRNGTDQSAIVAVAEAQATFARIEAEGKNFS